MQLDSQIQNNIEEHMHSSDFFQFLDQELRIYAEECVLSSIEAMKNKALELNKNKVNKLKKSQLHSIPAVVQAGGMEKLQELAKNQADKQSRPENSAFWGWFKGIIAVSGDIQEGSLPAHTSNHLKKAGIILPDPDSLPDKKSAKAQRKANAEYIKPVLERVLPVFCEHFICHYNYQVQEEK